MAFKFKFNPGAVVGGILGTGTPTGGIAGAFAGSQFDIGGGGRNIAESYPGRGRVIDPIERDGFWYSELGLDPNEVQAFMEQTELGRQGFNPGSIRRSAERGAENAEVEYIDPQGRYISSELTNRIRTSYNEFVTGRQASVKEYLGYKDRLAAQPGRQGTIITPVDNKVAKTIIGTDVPAVSGTVIGSG